MNNSMTHLAEIAAGTCTLVVAAASHVVLAMSPTADQQYALQWFLIPLLGSIMASACALFLNPNNEARKTVVGRCIFSVVFGTAVPKFVSLIHPAIKEWSLDPAFLFLAGFLISLAVYAVSRPLVERLFTRSADIVDAAENVAEKKFGVTQNKPE